MFEFENNEKLKVELLSEISFNKSNNYLKYSKNTIIILVKYILKPLLKVFVIKLKI